MAYTYASQGVFTCRVRVTDDEDSSATATVSISVDVATYTASGYVKTSGAVGIAGVTMNFTGGLASVTTDSNGHWVRDSIPDGTYTVTPSKSGYTFAPSNRNFTISGADVVVSDFTGTQNTYTASGYVKDGSAAGMSGVTMSFTGGLASVNTNASGYWARNGIANGSYTVTPSKTGYNFAPTSRNFTISGGNVSVNDFTGSPNGPPPTAALSASPRTGAYPLVANFDASASSDAGGTITKFEWDWDGDGTYDFDSGTDATVSHTYSTYGVWKQPCA